MFWVVDVLPWLGLFCAVVCCFVAIVVAVLCRCALFAVVCLLLLIVVGRF